MEDHFEVLIGMAWPYTRTGKPEERQMAVQKLTHGMLAKLLPGGLGCGGMCRAVLGCAGLCWAGPWAWPATWCMPASHTVLRQGGKRSLQHYGMPGEGSSFGSVFKHTQCLCLLACRSGARPADCQPHD